MPCADAKQIPTLGNDVQDCLVDLVEVRKSKN